MIGETWTYVRSDPSIEWWEDYGVRTNDTEILELSNYFKNFLNTTINTSLGESWSLSETDAFTKTLVLNFANDDNYNQFLYLFKNDEKLVRHSELISSYSGEVGILENSERPNTNNT
jgi:hypothetical protein